MTLTSPAPAAARAASRAARFKMATTAQQHSRRYVIIFVFLESREQRATATIACRKVAVIDAVAAAWLGTACITDAITTTLANPHCAYMRSCRRACVLRSSIS
jgi:hypothetical protein